LLDCTPGELKLLLKSRFAAFGLAKQEDLDLLASGFSLSDLFPFHLDNKRNEKGMNIGKILRGKDGNGRTRSCSSIRLLMRRASDSSTSLTSFPTAVSTGGDLNFALKGSAGSREAGWGFRERIMEGEGQGIQL
jgi:hypothetical protein